MPNKRKIIELKKEDGQWKCSHEGNSGDQQNKCPKIKLPDKSGAHEITFYVDQNNSEKFKSDDPIWIHEGSQSPTVKITHSQIAAMKVRDGGKTLAVLDWNDNEGGTLELAYRLNFDDGTFLDPIIENGGGKDNKLIREHPGVQPASPSLIDPGSSAFWILMFAILLASILGTIIGQMIKPGR